MASQGEGSRSHHRRRPLRPVRTRSLSPPLTAGSASQPVSPRLIRLYPKPQLTLDVRPRARPRARPSRDPNPNVTFNTRMVLTPPSPTPFPGTLTKQQGKPAGATRAASIVRTSRDGLNVPPAWSAGSANQGAGANTIASDPLLRRTINQISRQTLNERTHEQTTHAARDKNSLPNVTNGRPFAATSAVPRRKSPEEVAAMRPAWDGSPKDTAAHPGGEFILIIVRAIRMMSCFGYFGYFGYFWLFFFGFFGYRTYGQFD